MSFKIAFYMNITLNSELKFRFSIWCRLNYEMQNKLIKNKNLLKNRLKKDNISSTQGLVQMAAVEYNLKSKILK